MNLLNYSSFQTVSFQATVFTPDEDFRSAPILKDFYAKHSATFDADPISVPPIPGAPGDIPRVTLNSLSGSWRCEFAPTRANLFCRKHSDDAELPDSDTFFTQAIDIFSDYLEAQQARIGRLAALTARVARHDNPGLALARHFCKERWDDAPLDRPENFELHAHKRFLMSSRFRVNSWVRNKTGILTSKGEKYPIILVEQDLNTLHEEAEAKAFHTQELGLYFHAAVSELDTILRLYYPEDNE